MPTSLGRCTFVLAGQDGGPPSFPRGAVYLAAHHLRGAPMDQDSLTNDRDVAFPGSDRVLRVAVVDDFAPTRALVRATLERSGIACVVVEAPGMPEDVPSVCTHEPDVVLLDQSLGDVRGTELIGDILRECPTAMVAIFSALDPATEEEAAIRAGAFTYYEKDLITDVLPEVLCEDYALFQRALAGEDVCVRSATDRRGSLSNSA